MTYEEWKKGIDSPQSFAIFNASTIKDLIDDLNNLESQLLRQKIERQQATIHKLEEWIAAIADDHQQIPDWIQQSARSLLAQEEE